MECLCVFVFLFLVYLQVSEIYGILLRDLIKTLCTYFVLNFIPLIPYNISLHSLTAQYTSFGVNCTKFLFPKLGYGNDIV